MYLRILSMQQLVMEPLFRTEYRHCAPFEIGFNPKYT
jgi:hypothetical protein